MEINIQLDRDWFISQYTEIHRNLHFIEMEIEKHIENKKDLIGKDETLEDLKNKTLIEIERLNNTRKYEREIFSY